MGVRAAGSAAWGKSSAFPHLPVPSSWLSQPGKRTTGPSRLGQARTWNSGLGILLLLLEQKCHKELGRRRSGRGNSCAPHIWILILPLVFSSLVLAKAAHLSAPGSYLQAGDPRRASEHGTVLRWVRTGCVARRGLGARGARCPGFAGAPYVHGAWLLSEGTVHRPPFLVLSLQLHCSCGGGGPVFRARNENRGLAPPLGESTL